MSELNEYVIYIQLSRTSERRVHSCSDFEKSSLLITLCGHVTNENSDTVNLLLEEDIRYKMCNVKSLNLLPAVLTSQRASNAGFDETVFVRDGIVTECSKSNIFAIFSNKIVTHPESRYILPGITRKNVINTAETLGIKVEERCFTTEELFESDGAFITSTTKLIRRVHKIDNFTISDVSKELINCLFESILGDYYRFCC
jgi:D-alanine transaminase